MYPVRSIRLAVKTASGVLRRFPISSRVRLVRMVIGVALVVAHAGPTHRPANAAIGFTELARFDLSLTASATGAAYIGSNPIAVAWNGSRLWVAGYNGTGAAGSTSIIEITNATQQGFVSPTYSNPFGTINSVPNSRGYTGLAISGTILGASLDLGANSPDGIQAFSTYNEKLWNLSASGTNAANVGTTRGMAGPAFDPGFQGNPAQGSGLAWVTQTQGRRFLNDSVSGSTIYTVSGATAPAGSQPGMIIASTQTTWRDIAFNPATGDLYARRDGNVTQSIRTGSNALGTSTPTNLFTAASVTNNFGTNLAYLNAVNHGTTGDFLLFNDRTSTASGQALESVVKLITTSGSSVGLTWSFLSGSTPAAGNALYDFSWDSGSQTFALMDFSNMSVSIFAGPNPVPPPSPKSLVWNTANGTWSSTVANWTTGTGGTFAFTDLDSATFNSTTGGSITCAGLLLPSGVTVSAASGTYALTTSAGNQLTGSFGLVKSGNGVLILSGPNSYTGTTALQGGILRVADDAAFGTGVLVLQSGTLSSSNASPRTIANQVSLSGSAVLGGGAGTGALTFTGAVDLQGGTRRVSTVADVVMSGVISNGGLTKAGPGILSMTGENMYTGTTTVSAGVLQIGNGGTSGSVAGNIINNATLVFQRADSVTYSGTLSGNGVLLKQGAGALTLTSAHVFAGSTSVANGTLAFSGSGGLPSSSVLSVGASAVLDVSGVSAGWRLNSGQRLTGEGAVVGPAVGAVGSIVNPGSIGGVGRLTMTDGISLLGDLVIDISGSDIDLLDASGGVLSIDSATVTFNEVSPATGVLVFATYSSLSGGAFAMINGLPPGFLIDYNYLSGKQIALVAVPEPSTCGLATIGCAGAGLFWARRRREQRTRRRRVGRGAIALAFVAAGSSTVSAEVISATTPKASPSIRRCGSRVRTSATRPSR